MIVMTLSEIANACGGKLVGEDKEIRCVSTDTRTIENGSLFIAIKGENFDGHKFCNTAKENGADAIFVCEDVDCDISKVIVDDTRLAQLRLARHYREKFNIPVVGVTGSVGKTTTKEMIYSVLQSKYSTLKTEGNFNNDIGVPRMLFRLDETYQAGVFEMGMSNLGEISELTNAVKPTISVISNIGVSHLENLKTRENILKAKLEILEGMDENAPLVINLDNDMLQTVKLENRPVLSVGIENRNADFVAENIRQENEKTYFQIVCKDYSISAVIPTIGIHNVYNALVAFCVGVTLGIDKETCASALSNYAPAGMRQKIRRENGITFIEDCYNASPDSQKAGINALMDIKAIRHIAVLGDMLELGSVSKDAHYQVGEYAAKKNVDVLLCFGKEGKYIYDGAKDNSIKEAYYFQEKEELSKALLEKIRQGDAVSFKASRGMKLEEVIKYIYKGLGIKDE